MNWSHNCGNMAPILSSLIFAVSNKSNCTLALIYPLSPIEVQLL